MGNPIQVIRISKVKGELLGHLLRRDWLKLGACLTGQDPAGRASGGFTLPGEKEMVSRARRIPNDTQMV